MCRPSITTWMLQRVRWLRGSAEVQTGHLQAIIGTPCEVPEPRMMTSMTSDDGKVKSAKVMAKGGPASRAAAHTSSR